MDVSLDRCRKWSLVCLSGLLGAGFWAADALAGAYLFQDESLVEQFLHPDPIKLWTRLSVLGLSLGFGFFAQLMLHRADTATERARTAEHFLDSLIDNLPLMIFIKDAEHLRFTRVNKMGEKLMGYNRDAMIGKNDFDFFPHEQAEFFTAKDRAVLQNRVTLDIPEEDIDTGDSGRRILHTRKMPILNEQGEPAFILGISEDITRQKQAQRELLQAKANAERYLQISATMIVGLDSMGCIALINQRGCEILGRPEEDLLGQCWFDIAIQKARREDLYAVFIALMAGEPASDEYHEIEVLTADGDIRCLLWRNTPQYGQSGEIVGTLSSGLDITERRMADDQLRLAGVVFESTKQGVLVTDKQNRIVFVNPAFSVITGYTQDEVLGRSPSYINSGHHDKEFYRSLWGDIKRNGHWEGELWDRRKNGEAYPSWQSISAVTNVNNELSHYVSVFSDITPIKEHQKDLDFLAHHDPLTGLPNRLMFNDRVEHALQRCMRDGTELALLFMDLDEFKAINDTHGHATGDHLLRTLAARLKASLRKEDTVARLGGDEFLILLDACESGAGVEEVVKKIIREISLPVEIDFLEISVRASIGIAMGPGDGTDSLTLIKAADAAMYRAKGDGPGNYRFWSRAA